MSTEANKALVHQFYERINQGDLSAVDAYISPRFTDRNAAPDSPTRTPGVEGVKYVLTARRDAFPDLHYTIEDLLAEGDKVVVRETIEGSHQGDFWGIAPTGKHVRATHLYLWRIEDGKIVDNWDEGGDIGSQLRQS
jgi:predicted ester cyclase